MTPVEHPFTLADTLSPAMTILGQINFKKFCFYYDGILYKGMLNLQIQNRFLFVLWDYEKACIQVQSNLERPVKCI